MLKTDLSSFEVRRGEKGELAHFVLASYWHDCPLPYDRADDACLALSSQPLTTYILSAPSVRAWEPGVHYRLPLVACEALCVDVPVSLVPFRVTLEHSPFTGFRVDEHGRGAPTDGEAGERVYSTGVWCGAHTLCGLFTTEMAKRWAGISADAWRALPLDALCRSRGLDASWLDPLRPGAVRISRADPLLSRPVEVYRETA